MFQAKTEACLYNIIVVNTAIKESMDIAQNVMMLLTLKDDNTTDSFYPCHLFCVLSMCRISNYICTRVHIDTIAICIDGVLRLGVYISYWLLSLDYFISMANIYL